MSTAVVHEKTLIRGRLYQLALLGAGLCFAILFVTGFWPMITGERLHGLLLLLHTACGPMFISCVAYMALGGAQQHVFQRNQSLLSGLAKACYWLLLLLALPLTLSMVMSMFPWLSSQGQLTLLEVHRYSAMGFAGVGLLGCVTLGLSKRSSKN